MFMAAFTLQWQSGVIATEIIWFEKLKIFRSWLFMEKVCQPLLDCELHEVVPMPSIPEHDGSLNMGWVKEQVTCGRLERMPFLKK